MNESGGFYKVVAQSWGTLV